MIYLFTGTPGSGKSLNMARIIYNRLNMRIKDKNVIANFNINMDSIKSKKANFLYMDNNELTPEKLIDYSKKNLELGKEGQCLLVLDEAQILFNSRTWQQNTDRMDWIKFFTQHRKLGYDIYLITQFDRMLDRQIRSLCEYHYIHRKVNNFKIGRLFPFTTFIYVKYWYGVQERLGSEFFIFRKKYSKLYDSYNIFNNAL